MAVHVQNPIPQKPERLAPEKHIFEENQRALLVPRSIRANNIGPLTYGGNGQNNQTLTGANFTLMPITFLVPSAKMIHLVTLKKQEFFAETAVFFEDVKSEPSVPIHDHGFYEIAIITGGSAEHVSDGTSVEAHPFDAFIIPVGTSHTWKNIRGLKLLNIYYRAERLLSAIGAMQTGSMLSPLFFASDFFGNPKMRPAIHFRITSQTLGLVRNELADTRIVRPDIDKTRELFITGSLLKVLSRLAYEYSAYHTIPSSPNSINPAVYRLVENLDQASATGEVPCIADYAEWLGISEGHLARLFTKETGMSPFRFFNKRRIDHAIHLILSGTVNLTQIAYKLGFADSAHFSRTFKEYVHLTPSEFKQQVQSGSWQRASVSHSRQSMKRDFVPFSRRTPEL